MKIIPLKIPTPFYIGDVNVFLIKEEPLTLIDVGPKTVEAENALRDCLRENGVALEDVRRIVLTHAHEDHCGLAKRVRDAAKNAEIYVHGWETGHLVGRLAGDEHKNLMLRSGVPLDVFGEIQKIYADVSLLTDVLTGGDFLELKDEMELEFAGGALRVMHTPGHTPGSCSFFREANRTLIAGDTILKRITPNPMLAPDPFDRTKRFKSLAEFLVSLARIRALAPTLIYGGHGEPIYDFTEVFHRYVRAIDERQKDTINLIAKTGGATAWEAARKLFPSAVGTGVHQFLALSETVAHLDYAEAQGKIAVEIKEGAEVYRKI